MHKEYTQSCSTLTFVSYYTSYVLIIFVMTEVIIGKCYMLMLNILNVTYYYNQSDVCQLTITGKSLATRLWQWWLFQHLGTSQFSLHCWETIIYDDHTVFLEIQVLTQRWLPNTEVGTGVFFGQWFSLTDSRLITIKDTHIDRYSWTVFCGLVKLWTML